MTRPDPSVLDELTEEAHDAVRDVIDLTKPRKRNRALKMPHQTKEERT